MGKILLIDDDVAVLETLSMALEDQGHQVIKARDGMEGLALAQVRQPDIVVVDIDMPIINGYEVCSRLRNEPATRSIPVLFLSGKPGPDAAIQGLGLGAAAFLTKPFKPAELGARISVLLRSRG